MGKKYVFEEGMREISGMSGDYEQACRDMLKAGLDYWDDNPNLNPKFHGYKNIYGAIGEDNEDAKALTKAVVGVIEDSTGAMHQAAISSILWIRKNGWDAYVKAMKKAKKRKPKKEKE